LDSIVARQRGKCVSAGNNTQQLEKRWFLFGPPRVICARQNSHVSQPRVTSVEAGYDTSIVNRRRLRKGNPVSNETVIYGYESFTTLTSK
jgi:hypothetical protein